MSGDQIQWANPIPPERITFDVDQDQWIALQWERGSLLEAEIDGRKFVGTVEQITRPRLGSVRIEMLARRI